MPKQPKGLGFLPEEMEIWSVISKEQTRIKVYVDRRGRGRVVTIIEGIPKESDPEEVLRDLKKKLGCGGTYKDGVLILQGDHRRKVKKLLVEMGFNEQSIEVL